MKGARCGRATCCAPARPASAACAHRLRPGAAGARPAAAGRRPARGAGAAGGRIPGLHGGLARGLLGRRVEDHAAERPLRLPAGGRRRCEPVAPMEMRSHGIVPGVIQVPHERAADRADARCPAFGRLPEDRHGDRGRPVAARARRRSAAAIRFIETTWDEAVAALRRDRRPGWRKVRAHGRAAPQRAEGSATDMRSVSSELRELAAWLAATDIGLLELRGARCDCAAAPRRRVVGRDRCRLDASTATPATRARRRADRRAASSSVGVFLHATRCTHAPLVRVGARVRPARRWGCCRSARCCCR